jgi:hypothetical protein
MLFYSFLFVKFKLSMFKFSQNRKVNKHLVTAIKFIKAFRGAGMRWSPFLGYKSYTFKLYGASMRLSPCPATCATAY